MSDTIDLLESIGQNAALRHASAEELVDVLEQAQASRALKAAVACGDSTRLAEELGHKPMEVPHTQGPGHEEDEGDEGDEGDEDDDAPHPASPERDQPSHPGG